MNELCFSAFLFFIGWTLTQVVIMVVSLIRKSRSNTEIVNMFLVNEFLGIIFTMVYWWIRSTS